MREDRMFAGHYKAALEAPELTSHLGPEAQARAWALRAAGCQRKRKHEDAVEAWAMVFSLSSDDPWVLSRFAAWQLEQGRFAEGLAIAVRSLEQASEEDRPVASHIRGQALWMCGHPRKAISDFATAALGAPLNSPVQLCALVNIAVAFALSPDISPKAATLVLDLAVDLRATLGGRKHPRLRALLRWATGLALCARGRKHAGARDLFRARKSFLDLGDIAAAAVVTLDYATVTGRPQEPLLSEILDEAPVNTGSEVLAHLARLASGRSDGSQRQHLTALAVSTTIQNRGRL
jgi:hypothetical protein